MAPPTPAPPERPVAVPEGAEWLEHARSWRVREVASDGRDIEKHYRPEGSLAAVVHLQGGEASGPFQRFHPSGELAREGQHRGGKLHGDVVAHASREPTTEPLRACCVPPGAWTLRARYEDGRCLSETFYDDQGRLLLEDGTLHPDRPASVPEAARFVGQERRWVVGTYGAKGRTGSWTWWTEPGELAEEADYVEGRRHGAWRRYDAGELVFDARYDSGQPHGSYFARVEPGVYVDGEVRHVRGEHERGVRSGTWTFESAAGGVRGRVDHGAPLSELPEDHPALALGADGAATRTPHPDSAAKLERLARELDASSEASLALLASLRASWVAGNADGAHDILANRTVALTPEASKPTLLGLASQKAPAAQRLAACARALLEGVAPGPVLEQMASLAIERPEVGLDLVGLASDLDPVREYRTVRALMLMDLGHVEQARQEAKAMVEGAATAASHLDKSIDVTFPRFDFWPRGTPLDPVASPELPSEVEQDLGSVRRSVAKCAQRLERIRGRVVEVSRAASDAWHPPDVSALVTAEPCELESYRFDVEDEAGTDTVIVEECPSLDTSRLTELMRLARIEWTALGWLCWGAGLDRVAMPERLAPPAEFARALTTAFQRHWRATDRLQTSGLRARTQKIPGFEWEGMAVDALSPFFARKAQRDYLEMRAILFYLADATCRSPWQDDLRG